MVTTTAISGFTHIVKLEFYAAEDKIKDFLCFDVNTEEAPGTAVYQGQLSILECGKWMTESVRRQDCTVIPP